MICLHVAPIRCFMWGLLFRDFIRMFPFKSWRMIPFAMQVPSVYVWAEDCRRYSFLHL